MARIVMLTLAAFWLVVLCLSDASAQVVDVNRIEAPDEAIESYVYKQTPQGELKIHVHFPPGWRMSDWRPAVVFFFGGGWKGGSVSHFEYQAAYLARRGLVTARADYRVKSRQGTGVSECVEDAKSAIRWLRQHATDLGVNPQRIVGAGGSAGGHIAFCASAIDGFDSPDEDLVISSKPDLLMLFNPVLSLYGSKYQGVAESEELARRLSPLMHMDEHTPPAYMCFGDQDSLLPQSKEYIEKAEELGLHARLYVAENVAHGFFNNQPWLDRTLFHADEFLIEHGYLDGQPALSPSAESEMESFIANPDENDEEVQTGFFKAGFSRHHPLSSAGELNLRCGLGLGITTFSADFGKFFYDIENETFDVFVPEAYSSDEPHGLIVYISPGKRGGIPWERLEESLRERKLIWIGANNSGNDHDVYMRRIPLALDAAHNMMEHYSIDPDRVYVMGISGGGRTASMTAFHHSDVWKGAAFIIGVNYWGDMMNPEAKGVRWKASFKKPKDRFLKPAAEEGRYVFLTGDHDGNRAQTRAYFEQGYSRVLKNAVYIQVPEMDHRPPPLEQAVKILDYLDKPYLDSLALSTQ